MLRESPVRVDVIGAGGIARGMRLPSLHDIEEGWRSLRLVEMIRAGAIRAADSGREADPEPSSPPGSDRPENRLTFPPAAADNPCLKPRRERGES